MRSRTVHLGRTGVNTLGTGMDAGEGRRLEAVVRERWTGKGGMRGLCKEAGVTPEALYTWFRGENYPSLAHFGALAKALGMERAELVAVMDGYDLAAARRDRMLEEVEAAVAPLRQLLRDAGLLPGGAVPDASTHAAPR